MASTASSIEELLAPYLKNSLSQEVLTKLETYLELLLRWNARTNLTSIRDRDSIVRRHFGESLFLGQRLPAFETMLDFGTGAGFPGIPIQLLYPGRKITLAESQGKKASFLREAVRVLELGSEVYAKRVEEMPSNKVFELVTMRAVDAMASALPEAAERVQPGGSLALLVARDFTLSSEGAAAPVDFLWKDPIPVPGEGGMAWIGQKPQ